MEPTKKSGPDAAESMQKGYDFYKLKKKLKKHLDQDRYEHTLGVMYTCACLAMRYEAPLEEAQAAGLLHDCAKCIPNHDKLRLCKKFSLPVSKFEEDHLYLLHAKMGAYLARKKYQVEDPQVLSAIACHTTGKPQMDTLEKILYVADYIEPLRDKAPRLAKLRRLAFEDLDECVYEILKDTLRYLSRTPEDLDRTTESAFRYYEKLHQERLEKEDRP